MVDEEKVHLSRSIHFVNKEGIREYHHFATPSELSGSPQSSPMAPWKDIVCSWIQRNLNLIRLPDLTINLQKPQGEKNPFSHTTGMQSGNSVYGKRSRKNGLFFFFQQKTLQKWKKEMEKESCSLKDIER